MVCGFEMSELVAILLVFVVDLLMTLIGRMIFLSPFIDVISMSISTSFSPSHSEALECSACIITSFDLW